VRVARRHRPRREEDAAGPGAGGEATTRATTGSGGGPSPLLSGAPVHPLGVQPAGTLVQREESGATAVRPATDSDRRELVAEAIRFFQNATGYFGARVTIDAARLRRTLGGWHRTLTAQEGLIQDHLGGDPALLGSLRREYTSAVTALIRAAAAQLDATTHELYQEHRSRIHEVAWPAASADPNANELLDTVPEADRRRIRVMMTLETVQLSRATVDSLFSTRIARMTVPLPADVTVRFNSSISSALEDGLRNVAGTLVQRNMSVDRMITVPLDLERHGGDYAAYRFTFVRQGTGGDASREMLIERLGTIGVESLRSPVRAAAEAAFGGHGMVRGSGWGGARGEREFEAVLGAVALVPSSQLGRIAGVTFVRERGTNPEDPRVGGKYDMDTHTITLYDPAFQTTSNRVGTPGQSLVDESTRAVAHEIGHAIDRHELRLASNRFDAAQEALRPAFAPHETPPSGYSGPRELQQAAAAARRAMLRVRSRSGLRYAAPGLSLGEGPAGADRIAFRQAALRDGTERISTYSDDAWEEYFAESFSLYMADPDTLRRLRPAIHAHFTATYPR
jgi:hypothetical protein